MPINREEKLYWAEVEFMKRVSEAGWFDIEHLMNLDRGYSLLTCLGSVRNDDDLRLDAILYAKMGIHKYNLIQGTNLEFSYIEKYNFEPQIANYAYNITVAAKDPDAGGSLVPFQTRVVAVGGVRDKLLSCYIARIKQENHSLPTDPNPETTIDDFYKGELPPNPETTIDDFYKGELPVWPSSENDFGDETRFYVLKEPELREYDWLHLYLELAFHISNLKLLRNPMLSTLKIVKVAVETKGKVEPPSERLKSMDAIFYIRYRYNPRYKNKKNKGRRPDLKSRYYIPPCERVGVVRRTMNMNTGILSLHFDGKTFRKDM